GNCGKGEGNDHAAYRDPRRAPGLVESADEGAGAPPTPLREDRPVEPRLGPARSNSPLLGDREPHEPLVTPPRPWQRPLLRRAAACPLGGAGHPCRQSSRRVALREIEGAAGRSVRTARRALSADDRPQRP